MAQDAPAATGAPDTHYNLISLLYHELRQAQSCAQYIQDASEAHDEALADFFRECQGSAQKLADRAKQLLASRVADAAQAKRHADARVEESSKESFPASDAPAY